MHPISIGAYPEAALCAHELVADEMHGDLQSDWDIVKRGWYAHVLGEAEHTFTDPVEAVETLRVSCTGPCRGLAGERTHGVGLLV